MAWKIYKLVYRVKNPIHIGWHTLGYIKLTRPYITGKAMWGAATANMSRIVSQGNFPEYEQIGSFFNYDALLSYFFPAIDHTKPMLPEYTEEGIFIGKYDHAQFEKVFIKTFGQTGIGPIANTAEEKTLHESEFMSPVITNNTSEINQDLLFVGYLLCSNKAEMKYKWEDLLPALNEIYIGGDRKYGWGALSLVHDCSGEVNDKKLFEHDIVLEEKKLNVNIQKGKAIPAHLEITPEGPFELSGDIEPFVGREWGVVSGKDKNKNIGFGRKISDSKICWVPGSRAEKELTLSFNKYGLLS